MLRGEDRLDAAAAAEVERGLDRPADRQVREQLRRRRDAEHVLAPLDAVLPVVVGQEELVRRGQVDGRADAAARGLDEPERLDPVER